MAWIQEGVRHVRFLDVRLQDSESGREVVSGWECLRCLMCGGGRGRFLELLPPRHSRLRHGEQRYGVLRLHLGRIRLFVAFWWEVRELSLSKVQGSGAGRWRELVRHRPERATGAERAGWQEAANPMRWLVQGLEA